MVKLTIVYYSSTGNGTKMAQFAKEAAEKFGAEVRLRKVHELAPDMAIDSNPLWRQNVEATKDIPEATSEDLTWADALIFSSPSRFGVMASQMKQFLDLQGGPWSKGLFANKFVTAFTSAQNPHGGQEKVIESIYTVMQHWSAIVVSPGYINPATYAAGGNPYGTSATIGSDGEMLQAEEVRAAIHDQTVRLLEVAKKYVGE
ncbi:NAD(P)H:quinone oxidoreductase type IV [Enterococcus nangangensis]|uniref:NAD(P)H:quinone oxidoreductase type IV n=1 Tax=Enterococcus nangangensis TaxID=2559926 RepID=UPI001BB1FCA4|nr:NAD(P)H:quinone oxidoreductase type IV [Enterococcus nangangensis]